MKKALTQTEIMIAVAVISIFFLAGINTYFAISKAITSSKTRTIAINIAREKIEYFRSLSYYKIVPTPDSDYSDYGYDNTYFKPETINVGGVDFIRRVLIRKAVLSSDGHTTISSNLPDTGNKEVTVWILWNEGGRQKTITETTIFNNPDMPVNTVTIQGVIKDTNSVPINGAYVVVAEYPDSWAYSDSAGIYSLTVPSGTYTLIFSSKPYYRTYKVSNIQAFSGVVTQNVNLWKVVWVEYRGFIARNNHLVISAVCGGFDDGGSENEFIELYNPTTYNWVMDSNKFKLYYVKNNNQVEEIPLVFVTTYVPSYSYYLIGSSPVVKGVNSDAYYLENKIAEDKRGGVGIWYKMPEYNYIVNIDSVGWFGKDEAGMSGQTPAVWAYEGWPSDPTGDGIPYNTLIKRYAYLARWDDPYYSPSGTSGNVYGAFSSGTVNYGACSEYNSFWSNAYDKAGYNWYDFKVDIPINNQTGTGSSSPRNSSVMEEPAGGRVFFWPPESYPLLNVSSEDVLVASVTYYGRYRVVVGTHSQFSIFVSTTQRENSTYVLYQSTDITPVDTTTRRLDFIVSTPTTKAFIRGYVVNTSLTGLNNIPVRAVSEYEETSTVYTGGVFGLQGYFKLAVEAGTSIYVEVNMTGVTNNNYISLSTGPFKLNPGEVKSFENTSDKIILTQKGSAYGFVGTTTLDPLPGYVVVATHTTTGRAESVITDSSGVFKFNNLSTGTWSFTVLVDAGESVSAVGGSGSSHIKTISGGSNVWVGTFTVSNAFSKFTGTCRYNGKIIDSGVLILASTSSLTGYPPDINQSLVKGSQVYYTTVSKGDGKYELFVRGGQSYYIYAWYTYFTGNTPTTIRKANGPNSIGSGATQTLDIDFP